NRNSEPVQPGIQGNVEHVRSQFGQPSGQTSGHVKLCCGICHKPLRVATPPWIRVDSDLYLTGILPSSSHGYPSAVVTLSCTRNHKWDSPQLIRYQRAWGALAPEVRRIPGIRPANPDKRDMPGSRWVETRSSTRRSGRGCHNRKSTRLNSSHVKNSYADFCLKQNKTATAK